MSPIDKTPIGCKQIAPTKFPAPRIAADGQCCRAALLKARDTALANIATLPDGWTRVINTIIAEIANECAIDPIQDLADIQDALLLCRSLMRDQTIAGTIEGIYLRG